MIVGHIEGATRTLGKHQGYIGLPVRDEEINSTVTGPETPSMLTAWIPTPKEIADIVAGAPIIIRLIGRQHPPIMVEVGKVPE